MKKINNEVVQSVINVLHKEKLFRYDCDDIEDSEVATLERDFSTYVGSTYSIAMNSCSSALFVSLLCAGVKQGDKVAMPAFTFIAVPSAIVHAGAQPVLVEVDENYVLDLDDFERKIQKGRVKALLLSYMRGRVPNLDKVLVLCEKYNVILLEDSAHSLGVLWKGKQTGTLGLSGAYSAQSYKMIDGGEGGLLVTNNKDVAFKAMLYSGCYESNWKKHFGTEESEVALSKLVNTLPAYNFRMSNLSAAVLLPQLKTVEDRVEKLNHNYSKLAAILTKSKYIRIPEFTEGVRPAADSIQWEFMGLDFQKINTIKTKLYEKGIKIEVFTGGNARSFWNWTYFEQHEDCLFTRDLIQRTADLRLNIGLTEGDIHFIGSTILEQVNLYDE